MSSAASSIVHARGITRIWDPRVWGTTVGAAGATVFVMTSRSALIEPWPAAALAVWAVAMIAYVVFVFAVPRAFGEVKRIGARQGFVYLGSVAGMLILIRLGSILLESTGRSDLRPALIVIAVGLHFLPFAAAFRTPMFLPLGATMVVLGAAGLAVGWVGYEVFAAIMAVVSGIAMLIFMAGDAAIGWRRARTVIA